MADDDARHVTLERIDTGVYRATNPRGGTITFGSNAGEGFSPVELLLAAIGGCSAVDVDTVTGRHADHETFAVDVDATYVRDETGNRLTDVEMTFRVTFAEGEGADKARDLLPRAVRTSHDRTCTVSRTIEAGTPISVRIA
ncbi:OsmC family protein [Euzebya sp.]|uniref:OsmC family protein n=1 Tax=Euzebya sp. TaxID=1971409 RepID=UPI0035136C98